MVAKRPRTPCDSRCSASSTPVSSPRSGRSPTATAMRSASGSEAIATSASADRREQQVERARLLRVGERDGREVGVGLGLLGHDRRRREAGPLEGGEQRLEPDAVHRRVGHPHVAGVRRAAGRRSPTGRPARRPRRAPRASPSGRSSTRPTAAMRASTCASTGADELGAVGQEHLDAVVLRRVVAGRHHHAGVDAEVADGEGRHRRRQRAGQQQRPHARHRPGPRRRPRGTPRSRAGRRGPTTTVVPPAWPRWAARPAAVRRTTARFMPFGPAAQRSAQAGGAEVQRAGEAVRERRRVAGVEQRQ